MGEPSATNTTTNAKPKVKPVSEPVGSAFETRNFEFPQFGIPKFDVPVPFREFAEKSVSQAKENYEKMKTAAEEATDVLEDTYATATKGASDYGVKLMEVARTNTDAAFDFASELMTVKTLSEMVELSTSHARKQFETYAAQSKELAALAQKVASESAEPIKDSVTKAFKKVA